MRGFITLTAAVLLLAGCQVEEAEYFDPTQTAYRMFYLTHIQLASEAATSSDVVLFDRWRSAPEEERETLHDRYFYDSRIAGSDEEGWRIIDTEGELTIRTHGQPLSTEGAVWHYTRRDPHLPEDRMAALVCRLNDDEPSYELTLPGGDRLAFTATLRSRQEEDRLLYGCALTLTGSGRIATGIDPQDPEERIDYEITDPLAYDSTDPWHFSQGGLKLAGQNTEATAEYHPDGYVSIVRGPYDHIYWY